MRRPPIALALLALLALAAGCATAPPGGPRPASPLPDTRPTATASGPAASPSPAPTSPMPGTPVGTTASGGEIVTHAASPTVLDTLPSADARAVLATIPEPLPAGERVPPPKLPATAAPAPPAAARTDSAAAAGADSSAAPRGTAMADSTDSDVPIPEPTRPLGDRPRPATPDTAAAAPSPAPAPAPTAPPRPAPAKPDTCWRVQVAAVPESTRAEALRNAAESQLLVKWVIEKEGKVFKVRTQSCYGSAGADGLRKRAVAAGFSGAFRFRDPAR